MKVTRSKILWIRLAGLIILFSSMVLPQIGVAQTENNTTSRPVVAAENFEAKDNLVVTNKLKCITLDEMKATYTPADIYPAAADCIANGRYQDASQLYMLAGAYSSFDMLRVADVSAHQAKTVLILEAMATIDAAKKEAWHAEFKTFVSGDGLAQSCVVIRRIGPPSYYPTYMIQHGMSAIVTPGSSPLVEPFDASAAWKTTLSTYLRCPA